MKFRGSISSVLGSYLLVVVQCAPIDAVSETDTVWFSKEDVIFQQQIDISMSYPTKAPNAPLPTSHPTNICHNTKTFKFSIGGENLTCDSINTPEDRKLYCDKRRRIQNGPLMPIKHFCPESCLFDCTPTEAPVSRTMAPTNNPSTGCHDTKDFMTRVGGKPIRCSSIQTNADRIKYCDMSKSNRRRSNAQPIKYFCPEACQFDCITSTENPSALPTMEPTSIPTLYPTNLPTFYPTTLSPTNSPTFKPTGVPTKTESERPSLGCADDSQHDVDVQIGRVVIRTELCVWASLDPSKNCETQWEGKVTKSICRKTCSNCVPTATPTQISPQFCPEIEAQDYDDYVKKVKDIYEEVSGQGVFDDNDADRTAALYFIIDAQFCADPLRMIQRYISALFYYSTKGDEWKENMDWLSSKHECLWGGLECTNDSITEIRRGDNFLAGTLPFEVCSLPLLQSLDLDSNNIGGNLPSKIGECQNLVVLDMDENNLIGSLPESLFNIKSLRLLDLDSNQLTGSLNSDISNLVNLEMLALHINKFSGKIPSSLGKLKTLEVLYLDKNDLTGRMPASICRNRSFGNLIDVTVDCGGPNREIVCEKNCCTCFNDVSNEPQQRDASLSRSSGDK